jgi:hypothetical protein
MSFTVVRALAVGGQVVRVVFSDEPRDLSTAGLSDGRNAANYQVTIVAGTGQALQSLSVSPNIVRFPAFGLFAANEVACDLYLDTPVVVGLTYQVAVSTRLQSLQGEAIGAPYTAQFVGAARPVRARQIRRKTGLVDFATNPFAPGITVDSAGDWASHDGVPATKKRVLRRAMFRLNAFACLPGYGLPVDFKTPATIANLNTIKTNLAQGVQQEPDVAKSQTSVSMSALGYLSLSIAAKTTNGENLTATAQASQNGSVTS